MERHAAWLGLVALCALADQGASQPSDSWANESVRTPATATQTWDADSMAAAEDMPLPSADVDDVRAAARALVVLGKNTGTRPSQSIGTGNLSRYAGDISGPPLHWAGRLFFREADGSKHRCSAQFITPRVVLSAAHCVRDNKTGKWYDDHVFALQYNNRKSSKQFSAECRATKKGWVQDAPQRHVYDYAMLLVDEKSPTGHFGTIWNWRGNYRNATRVGYPRGVSEGQVIQVDSGPLSVKDGIVELKHGSKVKQSGSSGGAWVGKYAASSDPQANLVLSVQSFSKRSQPGVSYGPYFTDAFESLLRHVERGCRD